MDSTPPDYGISRVSGYYGPGAVLGWWLLTIPTTLNLICGDTSPSHSNSPNGRQNSPKPSSIWNLFNLDPSILAITGYPFIASLDLLANMRPYGTNPNNPALFCAPFLLILEGKLILFVILIVLGVRKGEYCLVNGVFVFTFLAYFATVHYALVRACIEKLDLFGIDDALFPLAPYSRKSGASQISVCQTNIDTYLKHRMYPNGEEGVLNKDNKADDDETLAPPLIILSLYIIVCLVAVFRATRGNFVKKLGWWDAGNLVLQVLLAVCCYAVLMVLTKQVADLLILAVGFLVAPIISPHQWGGFIPDSGASFYDLDQIAAFVVGGVVPLVLSFKLLVLA
ncbi:hypothetical protein B0H16DRAFT_1740663 [Mycena metata]|uniref:Uncharacterized protein n=1 Tax=Mycena metata TaxID=1033252 RepID=A0AAD7HCP1_9AGAR|nr:hypothetical protein B0H16DRAFT_1740663 [Mycena metata]